MDRLRGANAVTVMLDDDDRKIAARRLSRMVLRNLMIDGDIIIDLCCVVFCCVVQIVSLSYCGDFVES